MNNRLSLVIIDYPGQLGATVQLFDLISGTPI